MKAFLVSLCAFTVVALPALLLSFPAPPSWQPQGEAQAPAATAQPARPGATADGNPTIIDLGDHGPDPQTAISRVGRPVVWINNGTRSHTVTEGQPIFRTYLPLVLRASGASGAQPSSHQPRTSSLGHTPLFDSGPIAPGGQFSHTFPEGGTYSYYSAYSPGTVVGAVAAVEASEEVEESFEASKGGTVTTSSGAEIQVGANGLYTDTVLSISVLPSLPVTSTWGTSVGPAYDIAVSHEDAISAPMTITLPYDPSSLPPGADENDLRAAYYNGLSWILTPGVVDPVSNTVVVSTTHLSVWWILHPACDLLRDESVYSEEEKAAFELARDYMKRISADKGLLEAFRGSDEQPLIIIDHEAAEWLASKDLCTLAGTSAEEFAARPLEITAGDWTEVAQEMIYIGQGLQVTGYDEVKIGRLLAAMGHSNEAGVALGIASWTVGGPLGIPETIQERFMFNALVRAVGASAAEIDLAAYYADMEEDIAQWLAGADEVGVSERERHEGLLTTENGCSYDYGPGFYEVPVPAHGGSQSEALLNLYDKREGFVFPESPAIDHVGFVLGLQDAKDLWESSSPPLTPQPDRPDTIFVLLEYRHTSGQKRVSSLWLPVPYQHYCLAGIADLPDIDAGSPVNVRYYFIEENALSTAYLDKRFGDDGLWEAMPQGEHLCYGLCNERPNVPQDPTPAHGSTSDLLVDLSWLGGDPDGDAVTYDVYYEIDNDPPTVLVSDDQVGTVYNLEPLDFDTQCYWKIVAQDEHGAIAEGPVWSFTTRGNIPPHDPILMKPTDGGYTSLDADLKWLCSDLDGDSVTFDVYLEANKNPPTVLVSDDQPDMFHDLGFQRYDPGTLEPGTLYYWRIVAEDQYGAITEGPVWSFTTGTGAVPGEMVFIPEGEFQMGCDASNPVEECSWGEQPLHDVYLDAYYIDKYEVTNAQFAQCVDAGACDPPVDDPSAPRPCHFGDPEYAHYPVTHVSWEQAVDYCTWAEKRLPTEAEWEKAARGSNDTRKYPWGNEAADCTRANFMYEPGPFGNWCVADTSGVGTYPLGQSPYGVMDMSGNVSEWVNDWTHHNYYYISPYENPPGARCHEDPCEWSKVQRGGGWPGPGVRVASRHFYPPGQESLFAIGFRCAMSPDE